ncbi:phosphotransferase [Modestobacter lapidis]
MPPALTAADRTEPTAGWPPSLQLLLGPAAEDLWSTVLATAGGRLQDLRSTSVTLQPSTAATVQYSATVEWPGGRRTTEPLAAVTGSRIPAGAAVVAGGVAGVPVEVGVWRWPLDPALPGLSWAASAAAVAERLPALGLPLEGPRLRLRAYRPGRRAVIEVTAPGRRLFLKVVRPRAAERLAAQHTALAGSVPVPPVLAATADGVVVLPAMPGTPMRDLLAGGDGAGLPTSDAIDALLDALPAPDAAAPVGPTPGDARARVARHAAVLGLVAAPLRPRLTRLADRLAAADPGDHPLVPVHGDFYESQLLLHGGTVTGLLDVDTAGRGARLDDWATLLGHLTLLGELLPEPATVDRYAAQLRAAAAVRWPAAELAPRISAVLLGLATGPFRVQQRGWPELTEARLGLAERELDRT